MLRHFSQFNTKINFWRRFSIIKANLIIYYTITPHIWEDESERPILRYIVVKLFDFKR